METLVKGDVVVLQFPFSDFTASKKRPALIVANIIGDDLILAQITSAERYDNYSIKLKETDFKNGRLNQQSMIRPNKLLTADKSIISYKIGNIKDKKIKEVEDAIVNVFRN